jgi:transcription initiation factor TFIID subunit 9B
MLLSLASSLNSVPLPPILDRYGLKLPPPQHCLTNVNFSLVPNPPPQDSSEEDAPGEDDDEDGEPEGDSSIVHQGPPEGQARESEGREDEEMVDAQAEQRGTKRSLDEDEDYD